MRRIDGLPIKGGEFVVLKPGGYHIMLIDLKQPLKEGDLLKFTLTFEKAGDIEVEATVEPIGAKGPHGFDSQPVAHGQERGAATSTEALIAASAALGLGDHAEQGRERLRLRLVRRVHLGAGFGIERGAALQDGSADRPWPADCRPSGAGRPGRSRGPCAGRAWP